MPAEDEMEIIDLRSFTDEDFKAFEKENVNTERILEQPVRALPQPTTPRLAIPAYLAPYILEIKAPPVITKAPPVMVKEPVLETKAVRRKTDASPKKQQVRLQQFFKYTGADEERVKLLMDLQPPPENCPAGEILSFDRCWPYPFKTIEPENQSLVFFAVTEGCGKDECGLCKASRNQRIELHHVTYHQYLERHTGKPKKTKAGFGDRSKLLAGLRSEVHTEFHAKNAQIVGEGGNRPKTLPIVDDTTTFTTAYLLPKDFSQIKAACKPLTPEHHHGMDEQTLRYFEQFGADHSLNYSVFNLHMSCMKVFIYDAKYFFYLDLSPARMIKSIFDFSDVSYKMLQKWYFEGRLNGEIP